MIFNSLLCRLFFVGAQNKQFPTFMSMIDMKRMTPSPSLLVIVSTFAVYIFISKVMYFCGYSILVPPSCKFFAETYMNFLLILFWILSEIFLNSISEIWLKLEHSRQISESAEQKISKNFSNISVFFQQIIQFWNLSEFGTFQTVFSIQQSSENFPAITQQCFSSI